MIEIRVICRAHNHRWYLAEYWRGGELVGKASALPSQLRQFAQALDNNIKANPLISLADGEMADLLSSPAENKGG